MEQRGQDAARAPRTEDPTRGGDAELAQLPAPSPSPEKQPEPEQEAGLQAAAGWAECHGDKRSAGDGVLSLARSGQGTWDTAPPSARGRGAPTRSAPDQRPRCRCGSGLAVDTAGDGPFPRSVIPPSR